MLLSQGGEDSGVKSLSKRKHLKTFKSNKVFNLHFEIIANKMTHVPMGRI